MRQGFGTRFNPHFVRARTREWSGAGSCQKNFGDPSEPQQFLKSTCLIQTEKAHTARNEGGGLVVLAWVGLKPDVILVSTAQEHCLAWACTAYLDRSRDLGALAQKEKVKTSALARAVAVQKYPEPNAAARNCGASIAGHPLAHCRALAWTAWGRNISEFAVSGSSRPEPGEAMKSRSGTGVDRAWSMSAFGGKADIGWEHFNVRFWPKPDTWWSWAIAQSAEEVADDMDDRRVSG